MIATLLTRESLTVLGIGAIFYLAICTSLRLWQNKLIFFPDTKIEITPADLGLKHEEIWLNTKQTSDRSNRIHGWWIPSTQKTSKVLLYFHGNGENIGANLNHAQRFQKLGFSVLLIDYVGYGRSQGEFPNEDRVYRDARIAWHYLVKKRQIKPKNIFIYGHSLGGAIAIDLAIEHPEAAALIVESSFTSMRDMVDEQKPYGLLPIDLILTQKFDSIKKITQLQIPVLLIHGTEDLTVPSKMTKALFAAATVPKQLLLVPYANHNNVASVSGEQYLQAIENFEQFVQLNRSSVVDTQSL